MSISQAVVEEGKGLLERTLTSLVSFNSSKSIPGQQLLHNRGIYDLACPGVQGLSRSLLDNDFEGLWIVCPALDAGPLYTAPSVKCRFFAYDNQVFSDRQLGSQSRHGVHVHSFLLLTFGLRSSLRLGSSIPVRADGCKRQPLYHADDAWLNVCNGTVYSPINRPRTLRDKRWLLPRRTLTIAPRYHLPGIQVLGVRASSG